MEQVTKISTPAYILELSNIICNTKYMEEMELLQLFSNTHICDLKEVAVNIFGPNKSEGSMEEYSMQDACNTFIHDNH